MNPEFNDIDSIWNRGHWRLAFTN